MVKIKNNINKPSIISRIKKGLGSKKNCECSNCNCKS